jgi:hypothetical protein
MCEVFFEIRTESGVFVKVHSQPLRVRGALSLEKHLKMEGCEVRWVL